MEEEIGHTLGRIEEKIDGLMNRMDRQQESLYGRGGMETRVRGLEQDMAVIKTKAGFLSAGI